MTFYNKDRTIQELITDLRERINWEKDGDPIPELAFRICALFGLTDNLEDLEDTYPLIAEISDEANNLSWSNVVDDEKASWQRIKDMVEELDKQVSSKSS